MEITILFSFAVAVSMQPVSQLAPYYDGIFPNPPVIHALDSPKVERVFYSRSDCINHLKGNIWTLCWMTRSKGPQQACSTTGQVNSGRLT